MWATQTMPEEGFGRMLYASVLRPDLRQALLRAHGVQCETAIGRHRLRPGTLFEFNSKIDKVRTPPIPMCRSAPNSIMRVTK